MNTFAETHKVNISKGNTKMGRVFSVSLPPVSSCIEGAPCAQICYARKSYRMYPSVRKAWDENLQLYRNNHERYFESIIEQLWKLINKSKKYSFLFRWHVSGDIQDIDYVYGMIQVAHRFPSVRFLCFTKNYEVMAGVNQRSLPDNLKIVLSIWPNHPQEHILNSIIEKFPAAYIKSAEGCSAKKVVEPLNIPDSAVKCSGRCDSCVECFSLRAGDSVFFHTH